MATSRCRTLKRKGTNDLKENVVLKVNVKCELKRFLQRSLIGLYGIRRELTLAEQKAEVGNKEVRTDQVGTLIPKKRKPRRPNRLILVESGRAKVNSKKRNVLRIKVPSVDFG